MKPDLARNIKPSTVPHRVATKVEALRNPTVTLVVITVIVLDLSVSIVLEDDLAILTGFGTS